MPNLNTIESPSMIETESCKTPTEKKILYISWAESCSWSDQTARELGVNQKWFIWHGWGAIR